MMSSGLQSTRGCWCNLRHGASNPLLVQSLVGRALWAFPAVLQTKSACKLLLGKCPWSALEHHTLLTQMP